MDKMSAIRIPEFMMRDFGTDDWIAAIKGENR